MATPNNIRTALTELRWTLGPKGPIRLGHFSIFYDKWSLPSPADQQRMQQMGLSKRKRPHVTPTI
jgi:hypothetical protein